MALEGNERNSLAWLLPKLVRLSCHLGWGQMGEDLRHSDVNVKSVFII